MRLPNVGMWACMCSPFWTRSTHRIEAPAADETRGSWRGWMDRGAYEREGRQEDLTRPTRRPQPDLLTCFGGIVAYHVLVTNCRPSNKR